MARALISLQRGRPEDALEILTPVRAYDLAPRFGYLTVYARGLVLLKTGRAADAAREFALITSHRGVAPSSVLYPLAWLQLGRARASAGDAAGARAAYQQFLPFWKDADPNVPVLIEARQELSRLP